MDDRINENPILVISNPRWPAPKRLTLDQVFERLWPLSSDSEDDLLRKLRRAERLPTSHPAIAASREHLIEALDDAIDLLPHSPMILNGPRATR